MGPLGGTCLKQDTQQKPPEEHHAALIVLKGRQRAGSLQRHESPWGGPYPDAEPAVLSPVVRRKPLGSQPCSPGWLCDSKAAWLLPTKREENSPGLWQRIR